MFKLFISVLLTAIVFSVQLSAFETETFEIKSSVEVGKTPVKILKIPGSDKIHIFCDGEDKNFNYTIDADDEAPSWWVMDTPESTPRKVMDFDVYFKFPFKPGVDEAGGILYIPCKSQMKAVDLKNETSLGKIADIDAESINYALGNLILTINNGGTGRIDVYNLNAKMVVGTIAAGVNPFECIIYQTPNGPGLAIANQDELGSEKAVVFYGTINASFQYVPVDSVVVGNTINHIIYNNGKLYVTVNMSNNITVIDVNDNTYETLPTGTTGWNGPRESVIYGNKLYVTTYTGDIRVVDLQSGNLVMIYDTDNYQKVENMLFLSDDTFLSVSSFDDSYHKLNSLYIWKKEKIASVELFKDVETGLKPIGLIFDRNTDILHVFCQGLDANSNGTIDTGDEYPSWWTIQKSGSEFVATKRMDFGFGDIKLPFRPAYDTASKLIYLPAKNSIKSLNAESFTYDDENIADFDAVALDLAGTTHLLAAVRYENKTDSIVVVNLQNGIVLQKVPAGENVVDVKYYPLVTSSAPIQSLAVLTTETETGKSKILYGPIQHMAAFELENSANVGEMAVKMSYMNNMLGVASYLSNEVYVVDAQNQNTYSINLGTVYGAGPREIISLKDFGFLAGTVYGDIRGVVAEQLSDADVTLTLKLEEFLPVGIPVESLIVFSENDNVFIAAAGPTNGGNLNKNVRIINTFPTSVQEYSNGSIASVKLYPNPASDYMTFETELRSNPSGQIKLEIVSLNGNKIIEMEIPAAKVVNHTFNLKELNVSNGTYILKMTNGSEVKSLPFNIVK